MVASDRKHNPVNYNIGTVYCIGNSSTTAQLWVGKNCSYVVRVIPILQSPSLGGAMPPSIVHMQPTFLQCRLPSHSCTAVQDEELGCGCGADSNVGHTEHGAGINSL